MQIEIIIICVNSDFAYHASVENDANLSFQVDKCSAVILARATSFALVFASFHETGELMSKKRSGLGECCFR